MLNGIYSVTFKSNKGNLGTGTVVLINDRFYGGDASYFYKGGFTTQGSQNSADIDVTRHQEGESIFGPLDQFSIKASGTIAEDNFQIAGAVNEHPGMSIRIEGRKVSDL
jgi:hypothetical protein